MKVATWNVNSIRTRQTHVIDWLNTNNVDVLCLQETKVIDQDFPTAPFEELGYHTYIYGQKAYNGVAIFSRQQMTDVITGFTPIVGESLAQEFDQQKRVITGVIGDVRIINLYVPNGSEIGSEKYQYKLQWFKILQTYLEILREKEAYELCVCGDFNVALEDKDIYDPKNKEKHIMSSPLEREALQNILTIGLKDVFRKFTAEGGYFSWWDYRSGGFQRNRGWRIDHLYLTDKLSEKAISCIIDREPRKQEKPSDHTPVIVEF
ncbi:exodeoxyribonuclease III [Crocosphaera sp. XPORK-15E]|uniref:exodeoxyribonuclease III n=1 Tax=Crocosphaera sp. XPORK-15E TaxID=3110247 RepID=UPI002B20B3F9|nr:exodeoxyribonuclease III [Crocosphaera sp. XPORK-15E]MEA5537181.1 exodeoxyribonuclease III [Crocosphaera sp. XPORK-15E]